MAKRVALALRVFSIGLWVGERLCDEVHGPVPEAATQRSQKKGRRSAARGPHWGRKWKRYSGLFVLLKQKVDLSAQRLRHVLQTARESFIRLVYHPVRTYV